MFHTSNSPIHISSSTVKYLLVPHLHPIRQINLHLLNPYRYNYPIYSTSLIHLQIWWVIVS